MSKEFYHDLLLPEIIRYVKLSGMNPENLDEYSAAVFAVWYTQNPLGLADRDNICNFEEETEEIFLDEISVRKAYGNLRLSEEPKRRRPVRRKIKGIRFTAHTHPEEPLEPSPDDLLIYNQIERSSRKASSKDRPIHFIVDGYRCRRVGKSPDKK